MLFPHINLYCNNAQDVAERTLFKAADKQLDEISLRALKLRKLPNLDRISSELTKLVSINLAKNNLFDGDQVFQVVNHDIILCFTSVHDCSFAGFELSASTCTTKFVRKFSQRHVVRVCWVAYSTGSSKS